MKKRILPAILALSMVMPATAFAAAPEWHIDRTVTVLEDTELTMSNAPKVVIEGNGGFETDFSFEIELTNAEWLYGDSGTLEPGIEYIKFSDDWMVFSVDVDTFDVTTKDIRVPLYCKVSGDAEAKVICDDYVINSYDEADFAKVPAENNATVKYNGKDKLYGEEDELGAVSIIERYAKDFKAGEAYHLMLTNGFEFTDEGRVTETGDFDSTENFQYLFNPEKPDRIEIRFTKDMKEPSGRIVINGLKVKATDDSEYTKTELVITRDGDRDYNQVIDLGSYVQLISSNSPLKITALIMDNKKIQVYGTGGAGKRVKVFVGGEAIAETRVDTKGKWEIEAEFAKELENGSYLVETGYYSNSTGKFTSVIKNDINITVNKDTVAFKVGEASYTKNGVKQYIDAKLYIDKNDRMMIPVRALANALGVDDEDIKWDDAVKRVTITKDSKTVEVYIGSSKMAVNGVKVEMNTDAVIKDGRTYLPLRSICEAFDAEDIVWNDAAKTVTITK